MNNDGTYNIEYDDGDSERSLAKKFVRLRSNSNGSKRRNDDDDNDDEFKVGTPIEARYGGKEKWLVQARK